MFVLRRAALSYLYFARSNIIFAVVYVLKVCAMINLPIAVGNVNESTESGDMARRARRQMHCEFFQYGKEKESARDINEFN